MAYIQSTASGETIHLTDSADSKVLEFGLHGKAEQKQYSGKNLLQNTATTQTVNGVTFTVNSDGSVKANGTATNIAVLDNTVTLKSGSYILSMGNNPNASVGMQLFRTTDNTFIVSSMSQDNVVFTLEEETECKLRIRVSNGAVVSNFTFYPMIRLASITDSTYEPYVGGMASPSPDYPQNIEVAGASGSIEVESVGKNVWNGDTLSLFIESDKGTAYTSGTTKSPYIKCKENTTYTIQKKSGTRFIVATYADIPSDGMKCIDFVTGFTNSTLTITPSKGAKYLMAWVWNSATDTDITLEEMLSTVQIEYGTVATPYEAFKESTSLISTPEGLASVGGVYDEIIKYADGSGKRIQRIGKKVFDGSDGESWSWNSTTLFATTFSIQDTAKKVNNAETANMKCTHFIAVARNAISNYTECCFINSNGTFGFKKSGIASTDDAKAWVKANPITVWYELETPIITDLTAEEIAEIEKLHTFYPVTNISNDADCNMFIKYNTFRYEWVEPKTDWKSTDRFNFSDYNRIKNNLIWLHAKSEELWKKFNIEDMGEDITSYATYWNVDMFNAFAIIGKSVMSGSPTLFSHLETA